MRFLAALVIVVALGIALFGVGAWWEAKNFIAPGPAAQETIVVINPGTSLAGIAQELENAHAIQYALLFRVGAMRRAEAAALKAGEYAIPAHASLAQILDLLIRHIVVQHRLTIAEGLTSAMVVAIVNAEPMLAGEAVAPPPEGSLLPETYLFERGTARSEILARMRRAQSALLEKLWLKRRADLPFDSQEQALTLASIVEKESAIPSERPRIAAVFLNRLRLHMRLESDPTIIYGLTKGEPLSHGLRESEINAPNPYSTYQIDGLPPTPICNPGRDSIAAVLNSPDSDDLFFVADGSGGHAFAKTLKEHQKNVAAWRKIEQAQNHEH